MSREKSSVKSELPKIYDAQAVEEKWYPIWERQGYFEPDLNSSKPPFSIVMPPPNVTGQLHMGHALNITLQDILVRWKRMKGFNVLWVPGTDHAGIATQNVVERQLAEEGRHRTDLGREAFQQRVWAWKEVAEDNILRQIRKLGCSCDWTRRRFTMDEGLSRAVLQVFIQLHREGLIYRGEYLVNWCPRCTTAISDLEVEYEPTQGKLWYVRYPLRGNQDQSLVVATTRPETMLGDTAVAIHPDDERYRHLVGQKVILPLMEREIPVIEDPFVDREFGTGVVKVTPGHDPNDFEAGRRHGLPILKVIGEEGRMTEQAGRYKGLDRFQARRQVVEDLEALGLIAKVEEHSHNVGHCQRCGTIIEPLVSTQWFVKTKPLAEAAIRAVEEERTVFVPENFRKVYFEWMHNIHDWCISRQLWWGHRIPAWHCRDCGEISVAQEAPPQCPSCGGKELEQDPDVLDTWFSSALWPFSTLGWPEETPELKLFYPTHTLVTGFDIIFFWVARMMMMGLHFMGEVPFRYVYINGLVRDEKGQKMSKSRGNTMDPLEFIREYGADAIRFTLAVMAVPGTDIPFSVSRMAGYRHFCNKIWNACRFLLLHLEEPSLVQEEQIEELRKEGLPLEDRWILSRLQQVTAVTEENLQRYRFHEASNELYHFFWHELCDWYLELVKERITSREASRRKAAQAVAVYVMENSLRLLHPFVPFVTEELWQRLPHQGETISLAPYPSARQDWLDETAVSQMEILQEVITAVRTLRSENNLGQAPLPAQIACSPAVRDQLLGQLHHLQNLARLNRISFVEKLSGRAGWIAGVTPRVEFALQPGEDFDVEGERERLRRRVERLKGEYAQLQKRMLNEDFLSKAPQQVVENTRLRYRQTQEQLKKLQDKLDGLSQP